MEQVNALRVQAGEAPFLDVLKMEEDLRRLEKERETFSCLCGERVELLRRLTIDSQTLEIYKGEEAIASARCNWRALVERVRMVLHRDQLPNIVAQAYLGALNTKLSDYLSIFESTFMAQIKPDISIECQFPGGHIATAERLSGGQKVMLGIAFRFAIYDLFAQSLGFMVLDEPTVYLDSDHVESVFTLLERVKSYSAAAGLQLIVVTHEMRLAGVLDKVINLGLPVAC
jgi:DNA repair exonuclease SbcCD ATPase subunit